MGAEHRKTPSEAPPPGFAYLSSFYLKKAQHQSSKDTSVEAFDVQKLKKSVGNKPWMLNDKFDQIANQYQSVQPNEVSEEKARAWCMSKGNIPYFETSAKEGINVEEDFQCIAKDALKSGEEEDIYLPDTIDVGRSSQPRSSGCEC